MNKLKSGNIGLTMAMVAGGIIVVVALVVGIAYRPGTTTVIDNNGNIREVPLGATPGADRFNDKECTQGFCHQFYHTAMTRATSTPCMFRSPTATTSLRMFNFTVSSSTGVTATVFTLATSTLRDATTSPISYFGDAAWNSQARATGTLVANQQGSMAFYAGGASTTALTILPPNTYVTLGVQGGTGNFGTAAQVGGQCNAEFDYAN